MSFVSRVKAALGLEGSYRGPADGVSQWGNNFQIDFGDGFQQGLTLTGWDSQRVPAVYACVMGTARAIATCYAQHMVIQPDGKNVKSKTSPASRVLRRPNSYQTWPQFILNAVAGMLFDGESFLLIIRDDRFAVTQLHQMPRKSCSPYVSPENAEIFYSIGFNPMLPAGMSYMVPARDIIHLRRYTPRHPLIGESDITAAALAIGINVALSGNQAAFYSQMSRPSGILSTDAVLTKEQMLQLRSAFEEQSKGMAAGRIPVLGGGLKFSQMGISSQDAQLVQAQRLSVEDIARVFGVPLPVIGDLTHATLNNVESMINFWLSTGLGSLIENVERSFDVGLNMSQDEYTEFDVSALLRMDFTARVEGYTKSIQGGLLAPNEARAKEGLPAVKGGDEVFLQQQMVGITTLGALHKASIESKLNPKPAPAAAPTPQGDGTPAGDPPKPKAAPEPDVDISRALVVDMITRKRIA